LSATGSSKDMSSMDTMHKLFAALQSDPNLNSLPRPGATAGTISTILSIIFITVGAISVLMVAIGGIRYITSQGDPQAVSKAKGTIMYALIGLVVAIFSTAFVQFVLGRL